MPLAFADVGTTYTIRRLGGTPEVKKHLEALGLGFFGEPLGDLEVIASAAIAHAAISLRLHP